MKRIPAWRGWRWLVIAWAVSAVLSGRAEDNEDNNDGPVRFHEVKSWRGSFVAWAHQYSVEPIPGDRGSVKVYYNCFFTADFLLDEFEDEPAKWSGRLINPNMESSYEGVARKVIDPKEGNILDEVESFDTSGAPQEGGSPVELLFHRERGWSFHIGTPGRPTKLSEEITLTTKKGVMLHQQTQRDIVATAESGTATFPYPAKGMILFAGDQKSEHKRSIAGAIANDIAWDYTVYLEPASMEELRLEIDPSNIYEEWRPTTTPQRDRGKPLKVTAKLTTATGGKPQSRVERFIWELVKTSREPGVALNFPLDQFTDDPDLELDASGKFFVLSQENQKMERAAEGFEDNVDVVPFDWGGWSTLQVTAILADGRRVRGKLKGKSEYGLRVPKRKPDSHIADGWKNQTGASGTDKTDDEKIAGQKDNGDGFALYEEYRGWVENGKHIEGNPKGKDFFVLNLIGADAEPGIELFTSVSQLTVHSKLLPEEMSEETRLMNGNHSEGGRNKDQHGVWVKAFASKSDLGDDGGGARTKMNKAHVADRPGLVVGVGILARDSTESIFNKPFNLPAQDSIFAYDRAIAHELLHSVGVEHHGSGDGSLSAKWVSPRHPQNKIGRPYFRGMLLDEKSVYTLLDENGHDIATQNMVNYARDMENCVREYKDRLMERGRYLIAHTSADGRSFQTVEEFVELCLEESVGFAFYGAIVGKPQGEHSGDQDCLMRYYFAEYYPMNGKADTYYRVTPGTERIGMEICHTRSGTGINAPNPPNLPQSRYGDAAGDAGNCFEQICPNDAIPPRTVK